MIARCHELQLAELASQFAPLLGLSESHMKGRIFTNLVDSQDVVRLQEHMARTQAELARQPDDSSKSSQTTSVWV